MQPITLPILFFLLIVPQPGLGEEVQAVRPLHHYEERSISSVLQNGTLLLDRPRDIERFLESLDHVSPDWKAVYGPKGDGHTDRLFLLNRTRDQARAGNQHLTQPVAFLWEGVLSGYDEETGGFRLAIGPKIIPTRWGQVRFKPYGLPAGLIAVPSTTLKEHLLKRKALGETIEVDLVVSGRLIPEESIIYDFAHEEPGQGMVMPVVQLEQLDYFLSR